MWNSDVFAELDCGLLMKDWILMKLSMALEEYLISNADMDGRFKEHTEIPKYLPFRLGRLHTCTTMRAILAQIPCHPQYRLP